MGNKKCPLEKVVSSTTRSYIEQSYWNGKRVLVTGHTGFKGSWLTIWLKKLGCHITGIGLAPSTNPSLYELAKVSLLCDSHLIDIRDIVNLNRVIKESEPQIVFHLAAQALVRQSYYDPLETISTNVMGTANVLNAIRDSTSVTSAILITTDKVYKNNEAGQAHKEEDTLGGYDPYSASKAASELIIDCYRNSFLKGNNIHIASVRAGNVIGGGDWSQDRIIPDAIRAWGAHESLKIRNPRSIRPWQHVLEPLYGYIVLAQKLEKNPNFAKSYNFGPSPKDAASVEEVIALAQKAWGGGDVEFDLNSSKFKETGVLRLDTTLAQNELGVFPTWNTAQTIEKTINWYKNHILGANAMDLCALDISKYEAAFNGVE
jgi:CDP-glucose 4,6-dehydratase